MSLVTTATKQTLTFSSVALRDAYTDFMLSRQAMRVSPATVEFYKYTAGFFLSWLEKQSIAAPQEVTARLVRAYLAELIARELSDWTLNGHARAIRTMLKFWHQEKYMTEVVKFDMPKVAKKRLPVLSANEVETVIRTCQSARDKAIVLLMVDTGLRRSEVIALNWADVDFTTGLALVKRGKGGKARSIVIGATARRALLAYRRTLAKVTDNTPLIQSQFGTRFTGTGLLQLFRRIRKNTGVYITPHSLRRTFVILSLRAGMDVLHLQALLGHSTLDMVQHYAQMVDDDLLQAHEAHSPIDNLAQLR
ncbi:MAG TPA: tyrosine-type recombinase/integrase [Anaerolineales bacterium]|nr:tyrosine-type recombinase/integrase [Anaerolineales bacterium]